MAAGAEASSSTGPRPREAAPGLVWLLSLAAGLGGALALFPLPVLLGTASFWDYPRGIVGGSWGDMAIALSGYEAFVRDAWRLPVFAVPSLGAPSGTNVVFTDSIPLVLLAGRFLYRVTGTAVPLYGAWSGLCVVAMALASTALVRALGARDPMAGLAAALLGIAMPAFLARWGHLALMGQAVIPLALAQYVTLRAQARPDPVRLLVRTAGMCLLALAIHPYLFFMVTGIAAAGLVQAALDRRITLRAATFCLSGLALLLGGAVGLMGHLSGGVGIAQGGFGVYSMNLLGPVVPQFSGFLPERLRSALDATGGQYEGHAYLGAGVLLLAILAWSPFKSALARHWRRHLCLLVVMAGFVLLALSHQIQVGHLHLVTVPLPAGVLETAGIVRASGRFVWPALHLVAALGVVLAARRPDARVLLLLAALLQWWDAGPLREMIRQSVSAPAPASLDAGAWRAVLADRDHVVLDPPYACLADAPGAAWAAEAATQIQLMAATAGVSTNTLNAARTKRDCAVARLEGRTLLVRFRTGGDAANPSTQCWSDARMTVCGEDLAPDALAALLGRGD